MIGKMIKDLTYDEKCCFYKDLFQDAMKLKEKVERKKGLGIEYEVCLFNI
jgi:hypothetical protein